jgi:hypothetical protein
LNISDVASVGDALSLTCPNHQALFSELTPRIANLLKQQGIDGKIVRQIHRFVIGYKQSNASSSDVRVAWVIHPKADLCCFFRRCLPRKCFWCPRPTSATKQSPTCADTLPGTRRYISCLPINSYA